jgi:hypothetical protein
MSLWPVRRRASNVEREYKRIRLELVARARWEWEEDEEEEWDRREASMISSLNPIIWRVGRFVSSEWNIMFWSACIDIRDDDDVSSLLNLACLHLRETAIEPLTIH